MKTKTYLMALCIASLMTACSQKTSLVSVPISHIDVEQLKDSIDYNMDVSGLPISDLRILCNAPAARQGFPFKDSYVRGVFNGTTWYDSLMWKFDESTDFASVTEKDGESWRDYYYRASVETGAIKYTDEELAFIKRLEARIEELKKLNFDVPENLRVNMQNLANPTQLKDFDSLLCQQLAQDGFAIVPADHDQLFHVYEQNDYSSFPSFVTTDLFLQLYHLYIDCMLRELEENSLLPLMTDFSYEMFNATEEYNAVFFSIAYQLFTGKPIGSPDIQALAQPEIQKIMKSEDNVSSLLSDYKEVIYAYSLFRPRGHYTRTDKLQNFFRGMMWLQSAPFGMDHEADLKNAVKIAYALKNNKQALQKYNKMNDLITFLMGKPDNLSIPQVIAEIDKTGLEMNELLGNDQALVQLKKALEIISSTASPKNSSLS